MILAMKVKMAILSNQKIGPDVPSESAIDLIRRLLDDHPSWHRTRLSKELCRLWDWRWPDGQLKDMTCRDLLLKLERAGHIVLPPRRTPPRNKFRNRSHVFVAHSTEPVACALRHLLPLQIAVVTARSDDSALFNCLVSRYHYLGLRNTVGANMKYLVRDRADRPLSCLLFGSAAWKTAARDEFIGWDQTTREKNLSSITNNTRFLILPWVRMPHLASHVLSKVSRRLSCDWVAKYGYPIQLLETFVDRWRFRGTCYQAANWILLGQTTGRTRNNRDHKPQTSVKDVYVYPLHKHFREVLCHDDA